MRHSPPAARWMFRACGLMALLFVGCMPIGYVYPTVSYIAPVPLGAGSDEVRAVRVDVADDDNSQEFAEHDKYILQTLPLDQNGSFDPQVKVAADYGWLWNMVTLFYSEHTHHTLLVRLYRPGYQTIEIESWQQTGQVKWEAAPTLDDRETAIDDLVSTCKYSYAPPVYQASDPGQPRDPSVFKNLAPGSESDEHRELLLFAACEYDRLAGRAANEPQLRSRAETKAKALRQLAAK